MQYKSSFFNWIKSIVHKETEPKSNEAAVDGPQEGDQSDAVDQIDFGSAKIDVSPEEVKTWPIVAGLVATVEGNRILLDTPALDKWPDEDGTNGNLWCFLLRSCLWHGCPCESTRRGLHIRDHDCMSAFGYRPTPGEEIGVMVSGKCRHNKIGIRERTNIVKMRW